MFRDILGMLMPMQDGAEAGPVMGQTMVILGQMDREAEEQQSLPYPKPKDGEGEDLLWHPVHARVVTRAIQPVKGGNPPAFGKMGPGFLLPICYRFKPEKPRKDPKKPHPPECRPRLQLVRRCRNRLR